MENQGNSVMVLKYFYIRDHSVSCMNKYFHLNCLSCFGLQFAHQTFSILVFQEIFFNNFIYSCNKKDVSRIMFSNTYNVHFFMMINFLSQFHVNHEGKCNQLFFKNLTGLQALGPLLKPLQRYCFGRVLPSWYLVQRLMCAWEVPFFYDRIDVGPMSL